MSYIRGALPFLIYNPNTRDDIVPNGIQSSFELSQEVPGGYEGNVQVIRREFKYDPLIQSCTAISFVGGSNEIICDVPAIAAALSSISEGDVLIVEGSEYEENNGTHVITSVTYNGDSITIKVSSLLETEGEGSAVSLTRRYGGSWEIIEPIIDYTISGEGDQANKIINFAKTPQELDVIYVIHRGEATYNFVPSEKSVGPEQLTENLRNFRVDIFTGDGEQTDFTLSQDSVSPRSIEVSIDGQIQYGTDPDLNFIGDFDLLPDCKTISFAAAPANGTKVYVRHLGFSTVSRRQFLSPSQVGSLAPESVGTTELRNNSVTSSILADGAVGATKIQQNAVDGSKILLQNGQWLNWRNNATPSANLPVLRVDSSNVTTLKSNGSSLVLNVGDVKSIQVTSDAIADATTSGAVSIGTPTRKFADAHFAGTVSTKDAAVASNLTVGENAQITGNATVSGNLTVYGTVDGVDISALQAQVAALAAQVAQSVPAGTIKMWANDSGAPTGYLLCDGTSYSTTQYPALFSAIGYAFGGSGSTFLVPDFRGRFPLGKAASGTGSGWGLLSGRGGSLDHTHTTPSHTHGLASHTHSVPAHYHSVLANNSTINIVSSGSHSTSLEHTHGAITTGAGTAHKHSVSIVTTKDGAHGHSFTGNTGGLTAGQSLAHYHKGSTVTDGGAHRHYIHRRGTSNGTHQHDLDNTSTHTFATQPEGTGSSDDGYGYTYKANLDGAHGHTIQTDSNLWLSDTVTTALSHTHSLSITIPLDTNLTHSHTVTGSTADESTHTHSFTIEKLTLDSPSLGFHTHSSSNFAGAIGDVTTGVSADTAFNTLGPSTASTDAGGSGVTGGSNPAFQTINFIIKA